jgi:TonB family protein
MKYTFLATLFCVLFLAAAAHAQKKNGKVSIAVEKGGVEKGRIRNGQREGVWRTYNAKGDVIQTENYLNGKRDGEYLRIDDSVVTTGSYTRNQKNGTFITKVNGKVVSEIGYRFDTLDGRYFISNSEKKISGTYSHGRKTGLRVADSVDYNRDRIHDSTYFENGLRNGVSVIRKNNVTVSETYWSKGKRSGAYKEYDDKTGKLVWQGSFADDKRDGIWKKYDNGRLVRVEDYENGINAANTLVYGNDTTVIREVYSYRPDGELRLLVRNYDDGHVMSRVYYGPQNNIDSSISFYPNGKLKDAHYTSYTNDDGMTQFYLYMSYHRNGKLHSKGYEHRKARTGTWLMYDSLGRIETNISYQENKPFGWFKAYHSNGRVKLQAYCYEGITDTILVYSPAGVKLKQSDPNYSKTIEQVQAQHSDINFRDPNKFPPDHRRKGIVALGPDANEGKWADEPATFPGGTDSLNAFIRKMIRYPEPERRLSKEGEVHIKFLIEKDGTLSDIQIVKTVEGAPGFTKETMRLMRAMPKWKPAKTNGKIVRVYYILPVKFSLQ